MNQYEREEEALGRDYAEGRISLKEYNEQMREMQRSYRAEMQEACWDAFDRERDNW